MSAPRDLSFGERARWGTCEVCEAPDGEYCFAEIGIQLGTKANGAKLKTGEGAHLKRLQAAPVRVRLVPA